MNQTSQGALYCDMAVFTPAEREQHIAAIKQMLSAAQAVQPLANGYGLRFPADTAVLRQVADFIAGERLCCPFLTFQLEVGPAEPLWLRLIGGEGVKEFLRMELGGFTDRLRFEP